MQKHSNTVENYFLLDNFEALLQIEQKCTENGVPQGAIYAIYHCFNDLSIIQHSILKIVLNKVHYQKSKTSN